MSLTSKEAAESLAQAEQSGRRSAELYHYSRAAPHFMLWGAIQVVGYCGTYLYPQYSNWLWAVLILAGGIGGAIINQQCPNKDARPQAWRSTAVVFIALVFVLGTYSIMWPVHGRQLAVYPALLMGAIYCAVGLWVGLRYIVTGAVVFAAALTAYFTIQDASILLVMAVIGGGSMILAGFWFRTV
jgi:hypothetical protein